MFDVREMQCDIRLTARDWGNILELLKLKAPDDYNRPISLLEAGLREQLEKGFEIYRTDLLDEFFGGDSSEAETEEFPIIRTTPEIEIELEKDQPIHYYEEDTTICFDETEDEAETEEDFLPILHATEESGRCL